MFQKSVEVLNRVIADELSAIHQYMYWHFHCDDQGFDLLASLFKRIAVDEMMHIERVAERILFLEGDIEMVASTPVNKVTEIPGMLEAAAGMEKQNIKDYNQWALECAEAGDSGSRKMLEDLVAEEEGHYGNYSDELDNLKRFGESYLALQSIERSRSSGMGGGADA